MGFDVPTVLGPQFNPSSFAGNPLVFFPLFNPWNGIYSTLSIIQDVGSINNTGQAFKIRNLLVEVDPNQPNTLDGFVFIQVAVNGVQFLPAVIINAGFTGIVTDNNPLNFATVNPGDTYSLVDYKIAHVQNMLGAFGISVYDPSQFINSDKDQDEKTN